MQLPNQHSVCPNVAWVVDDPVLTFKGCCLGIGDRSYARGSHSKLQDNLHVMTLNLHRPRVVLCYVNVRRTVDAAPGSALELLPVPHTEACTEDPRQAVLCCAMISDCPTRFVLLQPLVVTSVILALDVHRKSHPAYRDLVRFPSSLHFSTSVLHASKILIETKVEHLLWSVLDRDPSTLERLRERREEKPVTQPTSFLHPSLQRSRPSLAHLARHRLEIHHGILARQTDLREIQRLVSSVKLCPVAV
mmetsp:Transcript_1801/g.4996  ORF Transcript_1801/g.4996 Transcript_1801/m.4996 type:complete len:248 (-) Transcript_1801:397-1140(-)